MALNRRDAFIPRKSFPNRSERAIANKLRKFDFQPEQIGPMSKALSSMFSEFGTDERLNYDVIESYLGQEGGQRCSTFVVAANDSSDAGKAAADYICTGAADEVVIQEALDNFRPNGIGTNPKLPGKLLFLEGTYTLSDSFYVPSYNGVSLEGMDRLGTILDWQGADGGFIIDSTLDGIEGWNPNRVEHLQFKASANNSGGGIKWNIVDFGFTVMNCLFNECPQALASTPPDDDTDTLVDYYLDFSHNIFYHCGKSGYPAIDLVRRIYQATIACNVFDSFSGTTYDLWVTDDVAEQGSSYVRVLGNAFTKNVFLTRIYSLECVGNGAKKLEVTNCDYGTVGLNTIETDLLFDICTNLGVVGNTVLDDVFVTSCGQFGVTGNVCQGTYTETTSTDIEKAGNVGIV